MSRTSNTFKMKKDKEFISDIAYYVAHNPTNFSQYSGPLLNPVQSNLVSNHGSPTIVQDNYYKSLNTVTFNEVSGDSIVGKDRYDIINSCLFFQCILPDFKGMKSDNYFYVSGNYFYVKINNRNQLIFYYEDDEESWPGRPGPTFQPGDILTQYYDGYNIKYSIINRVTKIPVTYSFPLCDDTDLHPEYIWMGFNNDSYLNSTFSVEISGIQARIPVAPQVSINSVIITLTDTTPGEIVIPNLNAVNFNSDANRIITGISNNKILGRSITIFNVDGGGHTLTFNHMDGSAPNGDKLFLNGSNIAINPDGNITFIYTYASNESQVWKMISYVDLA